MVRKILLVCIFLISTFCLIELESQSPPFCQWRDISGFKICQTASLP